MTLVVRGVALSGYAEVAAEVGLDARAMLRRLGIDARILTDREMRIRARKVAELLEQSAAASGCETFALRMAARRKLADLGPIGLLFAHQRTMRDALMTRIRFQRLMNEALAGHVEDLGEDRVVVREQVLTGDEGRPLRQAYELALGTLLQTFRGPTGPVLRTRSVHFTHGPPVDPGFHHAFFGPSVQFNSEFNGFICSRADLDQVNPLADVALAAYAERYIETLPFGDATTLVIQVQKAIHQLLPNNLATTAAIAQRLGIGERTMQRRLANEGSEFSGLLNEIRRDHALRHLANPTVPLAYVAGLVGYTHETSFARWFSGEFGVTPSDWRSNLRPA
jgi:AraC-like DNA-binding protein